LNKSSRSFAKLRSDAYVCNPFEKGGKKSFKAPFYYKALTPQLARPEGAGSRFRKACLEAVKKETTFFDNLAERYD